jgi:hypothetical protein
MEGIMVIICSLHSGSALNGVPYSEPKAWTILIHKAWRNFPLNLGGVGVSLGKNLEFEGQNPTPNPPKVPSSNPPLDPSLLQNSKASKNIRKFRKHLKPKGSTYVPDVPKQNPLWETSQMYYLEVTSYPQISLLEKWSDIAIVPSLGRH